jgi:hypothetical protein
MAPRRPETKSEEAVEVGPPTPPPGLREQLSTFVEWIRPYKEIATLLVALFAIISGGLAWTVSHFATRAALSDLECRINHDKKTKALADAAAALSASTELRYSQIRVLSAQPQSPTTAALISQLTGEVNETTKLVAKDAANSVDKINESVKDCDQTTNPKK